MTEATTVANPLLAMSQTSPTALWNDSSTPHELRTAIGWGAVGATCNPVIALAAIRADLPRWQARIAEIAADRPTATESQIGWQVVEELSIDAAALLEPLFDEHAGINGRLSMQTDPRLRRDPDAIVAQAEHFDSLARNIIVKIPATQVGITAIEEATYRGISVNVTVSFTVAQALEAGEAIQRGLDRRAADGHDISALGPVVTIMVGRLDDWLKDVVARDGLDVDPEALEWAGVAAFKKAYGLFRERGLRARLLAAAYRNQLQWTELVGGDIVLSPPFAWQERFQASGHDPQPRIDVPVEHSIVAALETIPDFRRAYEPDGLTTAEFDRFGATLKTLRQFLEADEQLDGLVRDVLTPAPRADPDPAMHSSLPAAVPAGAHLDLNDCRLSDLVSLLKTGDDHDLSSYPHADHLDQGVVVYDAGRLRATSTTDAARDAVRAEVARALASGPGIVVFTRAFEPAVVDRMTAVFDQIIAEERRTGRASGDHFATPGANDRVWNALEKAALVDPHAFVDYYANDMLALVATAWLGPGYQVTSQVNVVNPGGKGQTVHRDYHLGFQSPKVSSDFPAHVHALSPMLTLQGAVAHCDMPVESGPTLYLPHSQKYLHGYLAYWLPEFQEYFVGHHVQLPLTTGDAVFFNPALFHAAGTNHTPALRRMANLLQINSAFGRAMESVDRQRLVEAIYPVLLERKAAGMTPDKLADVVAASAEGYAFPTNLDRDPPLNGMSPLTQADLIRTALGAMTPPDELHPRLNAHADARRTH